MRTFTVGESPQGGYLLFNRVSPTLQDFMPLVNPELLMGYRPKGAFLRLEYSAQNITEFVKEAILASNFGVGSKEDAEDDFRITRWKWATTATAAETSSQSDDLLLGHEGDLSLTFTNSPSGKIGGHPIERSDVLVRVAENPRIRI